MTKSIEPVVFVKPTEKKPEAMKMNLKQQAGLIILGAIILIASSGNPPNGKTGAPGENTCAQSGCHVGTNPGLDGNLTVSGLPATIVGGNTYNISITVDNPNGAAVRAGFQWVALNSTNVNAGTISNASASSIITPSGGRTYHEHNPTVNFPASNQITWTADWTAPTGPTGDLITFYGAANITDGSSSPAGDRIRTTTVSGTLMGAANPLAASITQFTDVLCFGDSNGTATATATDGVPPYFYNWDNGEMMATATMLSPGLHTVSVSDAVGDVVNLSVTIDEPPVLTGTFAAAPASCGLANGSVMSIASGGTPGYQYNWSHGHVGPDPINMPGGNYFLTITDQNSCTTILNVFVDDLSANLSIDAIANNPISCPGADDGMIQVIGMNGQLPYQYSWSHGPITPLLTNLGVGMYTVVVSDANGCSVSNSYLFTDPAPISLSTQQTNVNCNGGNDGSITITATGGSGNLMYAWDNGPTNSTNSNLTAGTYSLVVSDEMGCTITDTFSITEPSALTLLLTGTAETNAGAMDGTANAVAGGGTLPYDAYNWSGPNGFTGNTPMITGLSPGTYTCQVVDDNGCTVGLEYVVQSGNCMLAATADISNVSCHGGTNGSVVVTATNGSGMLNWNWSNGAMIPNPSNLIAGFYSVTVSDNIGCQFSLQNIEITEPDAIIGVEEIIMAPSCAGLSDGIVTINLTGGTGAYTTTWLNAVVADTLFNVPSGSNGAIVTDENFCGVNLNFNVTANDLTPPDANLLDTVYLGINLSGVTDTLSYLDYDLGSTDNCGGAVLIEHIRTDYSCNDIGTPINLPVELLDQQGNITFDTVVVVIIDDTAPSIFCIDDLTINNCDPFTHNLPINFDNCDVTLTQIGGPANGTAPGPGTHLITYSATDLSGNESSCSFNLTVDSDLTGSVTIDNQVSCFGFTDACVTFAASGGSTPYTFEFTDTNITSCTALGVGKWEYRITDSSGCMITDSVTITSPDVLLIEAGTTVSNTTNSNSNDGAIDITVTGGVTPYQYEWFFNGAAISNMEDPDNLDDGIYTCIVTDANTCTYNSIDFEVLATTSVDELPAFAEYLSVYPNPASELVHISIDHESYKLSEIKLIDLKGKILMTKKTDTSHTHMDLNNHPSGIYFLKLASEDRSIVKKLIIQ